MPLIDNLTQNGLRNRAKPKEILKAYLRRIESQHEFGGGVAVISDQPIPLMMPLGKLGVTVSMGEGSFDPRFMDAGGIHQIATNAQISIGCFRRNDRERAGRSNNQIIGDDGITDLVHKILGTLTLAVPASSTRRAQQWEPTTENGIPLLMSAPTPSGFTAPSDVPGHVGWLGVILRFNIEFMWDVFS
jgi:hypothetical protein